MSARTLPPRPNLDQLRLQAHELQAAHRAGRSAAAARIAAHHPRLKGAPLTAILQAPLPLSDAQLVIAREYGFESWARLKQRVEFGRGVDRFTPHPRFAEALAALDAGDVGRLQALFAADPGLVHARTNLEPPYHYFTGATLLHHVAGNPGRDHPLPDNILSIARLLLEAGADVDAGTLGPNGGDTMGLLTTSAQASNRELTGPLMDLLLEHGARLDLTSDESMAAALANHAPRAAEKMIALGAEPNLLTAAALGRMDLLRGFFDEAGALVSRPRRHGRELSERDAIGLALLYAYVRRELEAVDFLIEKDGNWNMTGVNNGTALHRAAWSGDLPMVQRLVARGADIANRDNPFVSTPLSWAEHNGQGEVFEWLRTHCAIDLHDAVSFNLAEHVEARLAEDPGAVNQRRDHWDIPQGTALHWAAWRKRDDLARVLLAHRADPNIVAGNGLTALDLADASGATEIAALLEQQGGTRTAAPHEPNHPALGPFERVTEDILEAYTSGAADALDRLGTFFGDRFSQERPDWIVPMAATLTQERFSGPEWIFEQKFDGIRLIAYKQGPDVRLYSRNRLPQHLPAVAEAIASLPARDAILDGEVAWPHSALAYHVFDIMWLDGHDVMSRPLEERRALLGSLLPRGDGRGVLRRVPLLDDPHPWERAAREGWEGVIAKRRGSPYEQRRSPHWLKMKCEASQELVVGGFTDPQGARVGLGALLVGYFEGSDFVFAGKLGTGFDTRLLLELRRRLDALEIPESPFTRAVGLPRLRAHWVRPEIVVQVAFIEWTVHGKLRHPRLLGVRYDKAPREVVRETR